MTADAKSKALEDFVERLLRSPAGDQVASLVLFGSVANGEYDRQSDIDVLVFGTGHLKELSQACAEASFQTALEWGESVEPLVYCQDDKRFPSSYFLHKALQQGKEIFRMDEELLRRREAESALGLAREYIQSAHNAAQNGFYRLAIDAAYNSAELCVKGLLLLRTGELPRSHGGLVQAFGKHYVIAGLAPAELGRRLNQHLELRNKARYDFHARLDAQDAAEALALAEELVGLLEDQWREAMSKEEV